MSTTGGLSLVAGRLAVARGLARVPAAILPLVIVATFGAAPATDCFFLVLAAVQFVTNIFAPLLETVVVPFVAEHRARLTGPSFVRAVAGRVGMAVVPLSVALAGAALVWRGSGWRASAGWEDGWRHLLLLSCLPALNAMASVLSGYLNAEEWFLWAALSGSVRGVVALSVGLMTTGRLGLVGWATGLALGEATALIWLASSKPSRAVYAATPVDAAALRPFWTMFASTLAGGVANSSKGFVDRFVAAAIGPGAVSLLEAAERVFLMAVSFIGAPFATVVLSRWAALHSGAGGVRRSELRSAMRSARLVAAVLGLVVCAGYFVVTTPFVWDRVFARVAAADTPVVQGTLLFYLAGAVPYLIGLVASQAILIFRDSAFIVAASVAIGLLNVPLDLLGARVLGLPGIALASSLLHATGWLAAEWRLRVRGRDVETMPA